jgi:ABC-type Fe2+-enterobactin transport system substrate-binding protein
LRRPHARLFGNDAVRDELGRFACGRKPARIIAKEVSMRNKIFAITAIAIATSAPIAAQAQSETVGIVRGGSVVINDDAGIAVDQRPAFREYIVREHVPEYTIPDRVIVGGVLPESGVTYYDVPQTFGATPYRYTVVNGQTVLVEPRSRRIVQVVE